MRSSAAIAFIAAILASACDSPPAQQPPESDLVNATQTDQAFPSGADGNQITTGSGADSSTDNSAPPGAGNRS